MKKISSLILCISVLLCGCVKIDIEDNMPVKEDLSEAVTENAGKFPFEGELKLVFSSGVGAWASVINLNDDGSFFGEYYDSDMGVVGDDYPNGTLYLCEYEGKFHFREKTDDYSYEIVFDEIKHKKPPETEEIKDGKKLVYQYAYGIEPGEEFIFYLPGVPIDKMDEEIIIWAPHRFEISNGEYEKLSCYALYNVSEHIGFFGEVE